MPTSQITLDIAEINCKFRIMFLTDPDIHQRIRVREMGISEGRIIRKSSGSDPFICEVEGCRLGICKKLAQYVIVEKRK